MVAPLTRAHLSITGGRGMVTTEERRAIIDGEHLRLLPIGFWIRKRKHRTATLVIAVIGALGALFGGYMTMPFGILIAVFTFLVLLRSSVSALYGIAPQAMVQPSERAE